MFDTQLGDSVSKAQEEGSEGLSLANAKQLEEANGQSSANMEMLSITVPTYSPPSGYELTTIPRPTVSAPTDVVIEVHATSINPIDVKKASGALKMALAEQYVVVLVLLLPLANREDGSIADNCFADCFADGFADCF